MWEEKGKAVTAIDSVELVNLVKALVEPED